MFQASPARPPTIGGSTRKPALAPSDTTAAPDARVKRSALLARLADSTDVPLVVVSAGAGFGKTTVLGDWLAHLEQLEAELRHEVGRLSDSVVLPVEDRSDNLKPSLSFMQGVVLEHGRIVDDRVGIAGAWYLARAGHERARLRPRTANRIADDAVPHDRRAVAGGAVGESGVAGGGAVS